MGIIVKQFDGVSVTPKDDAVVRDLLFSEYGIFRGCGISFLGVNQIRIASGYMIVKGRAVAITEETVAAQLSSNGKKRGRLYIHFDFSNQTTPAQFLTQVADKLPELTQEKDANYNDGIFEVELCNYDVSEVAVSNIIETCPIITGGMDLLSTIEEVMANTTPGKVVDALVISEINSRLKADNGQQFQFAYDSESQKYGYMAEVEGADTFFPFSDGFDFDFNNAQIPVMTSATSPSGIVTSSGASGSAYQDWCAFNPTHSWWSVPGKSSWIQYQSVLDMKFSWLFIDFNTPEVIERTVKLEISLDGSSWETILDETLANNYMYLIHKFDKQYSAKYIKLTQSYPVKGYPGLRYMSLIK